MTTTDATADHEEPPMTTTRTPQPLAAAATGTPRLHPAALAAALRSEWIKFATIRANKILLAAAVIIGLLLTWATATFATAEVLTVPKLFAFPTALTAVLSTIAGALLFTSEVHHGTLAGSLTAHPSRWPIVTAKALLAAGFGLLLGAVGMVAGFVGALAGGVEMGDTSGMASTVLWGLLYTTGSGLIGLGVGMVVRHSAAAVSGVLVWWLVIEGLIVQTAPPEVVWFVPFDTGFRALGLESSYDVPAVVARGLSSPLHATIFWGYVMAALALGTMVVLRRDIE
jgi:hypothetical protein